MRKKILITVGVIAALLLLAVVTLPWWLGGALSHFGAKQGVAFSEYSSIGYGRWAIEEVVWRDAGVELEVARIEGPHPLLWWWKKSESSAVLIDGLQVDLRAMEKRGHGIAGPVTGPESAVHFYHKLKPMLPEMELSDGTVVLSDSRTVGFEELALRGFDLTISKVNFEAHAAAIRLQLNAQSGRDGFDGDLFKFKADDLGGDWSLGGAMNARRSQLDLRGHWGGQPFSASGLFRSDQWIPDSGRVAAEKWSIAGAEIRLGDYYQNVAGDLLVTWTDGRFDRVQVRLNGQPIEDGKYPPLSIQLQGSASMESADIRELKISTPGLSLTATQPFEISRDSAQAGAVSDLMLRADLAEIPFITGTGSVAGGLRVTARESDWPLVEFDLQANQASVSSAPVMDGELSGVVAWPLWEISNLRVKDAAGSEGELRAEGNGENRSIVSGEWRTTILPNSLTPWVNLDRVSWSELTAEGLVSGTVDKITHEGTWSVEEILVPKLRPIKLDGHWSGMGAEVDLTLGVLSEAGAVDIAGLLTMDSFEAKRLEIRHDDAVVLALQESSVVRWNEQVSIESMKWSGTGISGEVHELSGPRGRLSVIADNPSFDWIRDWWADDLTLPRIESLALEADWNEGAVKFAGDLLGHVDLVDVGEVRVKAKVDADDAGLRIEQLEFGQNERIFAQVSGSFPGTFNFATETVFNIDEMAAIDLKVLVAPNPAFWQAVGESQHVAVSRPDISVALRGTWAVPQATGSISMGKVQVGPEIGGKDWPEVSGLSVTLKADGNGLRVENGGALVEGQEVKWSGRLPVAEKDWSRLRAEPLSYLREQGAARIEVPRAKLATVAKFVPEYLVPIGEVSLELTFSPGAKIDGRLQLSEAVSRPLGPLGVLQQIEADVLFEGREIRVNRLNALMGGQPVRINGTAAWQEGKRPELNLNLKGTNLPLVRQTGLLLRGDLDLQVVSDDSGAGKVQGLVNLHDGLMLADVRSLVPTGGTERRESRPPYFSVTVEPFAEWELDLAVKGEPFMRLRTPVLTGEASIDVTLDGTLRTPRAIGEITLNRGEVKLPFARFEVEEGRVSLTEAQPYQPQLSFLGTGKRFGYDLMMELTGSANDPQLRLSSEPFLPAADVVLLVMAGVAPQEEFAYTQGERAMKLGVYFGQEVVNDLLGFEGDGKLALTTGEKLSRRGKETYRVGYDLSGRWTVTGEYDEFDHYNAGLKWRWLPKPNESEDEEETDANK